MSWSTKDWLKGFGLEQYHNSFIENGYETQKLCANLKGEDLDGMDITNPVHRDVFLNQAGMLRIGLDRTSSIGSESPINLNSGGNSPKLRDYTDSGKSPKKPRSNSTSHATSEKLSIITDTDIYTTVFDDTVDTKRTKKKIRSPNMPSKRTDIKPLKPQKLVKRTPSFPALRQTSESASALGNIPPRAMTKLQLKFRIKEMLSRDHIVLSHAMYSIEEGVANEVMLIEVAENYAEELNLEGLDVYDAVKDVWRYTNNEKNDYVLPKSNPNTPSTASSNGGSSFNELLEQSNYSEPFDATPGPTRNPVKFTSRKISSEIGNKTLPPPVILPPPVSSNYAEPFDAIPVTNQPVIIKTSPEKKQKTILSSTVPPKPNFRSSNESLVVEKRTSKTLPPTSSPNLSAHSSSSEDSPCRANKSPQGRRQWNPFHRSGKSEQTQKAKNGVHMPNTDKKKRGSSSVDDLTNKRISLPPTDFTVSPGLPRSVSSNPAFLYHQCLEDESKKNITGSHESLNKLQPNLQIPSEQEDSDDLEEFNVASRIKGLTVGNRSSSNLELSNMLEVYVGGNENPVKFQRFQSSECVTEPTKVESAGVGEKDEKKKSLLRRLFHKKKDKGKDINTSKGITSVSSETDRRKSGLTNSTSLPDITEYAEVFDVGNDSSPKTPPKLPNRNRPHSAKTAHRIMPSPGPSPCTTPIVHHKLMIKSDSTSSTEVIHSTPTLIKDDDIIEICVPSYDIISQTTSHTQDTVKTIHHSLSQPQTDVGGKETVNNSTLTTSIVASDESNPQTNQYDDPWKPILKPKPKNQKTRKSSSDSHGTSEEKELIDAIRHRPPLAPKPHRLSGHSSTPSSQGSSPSHDTLDNFVMTTSSPVKNKPAPPKPSRARNSKSPPPLDEPGNGSTSDHLNDCTENTTLLSEHPIPLPRYNKTRSPTHKKDNILPDHEDDSRTEQVLTSSVESDSDNVTPSSRQIRPVSLSGNLLQIALQDKLLCEGIDITSLPYSSQRGEYGIPSALVSRYSEETGNPEDEVAKMLDKVRRSSLLKARRGHIPLKKDWKKFSGIETASIEDFLISIGLPQYYDTLIELGYVSVSLLKGHKLNSLPLQESHKRRLSAFAKKL